MKILLLLAVFTVMFIFPVMAQPNLSSLYEPRDMKQAYQAGTRSRDGRPGKNYWQNHARYDITVKVNPPDRMIRGTERITYFNNSPDTLRNLFIKLFMNYHTPGAVRAFVADSAYLTKGVIIDSLFVNDKARQFQDNDYMNTTRTFRLRPPMLPGDSVHLILRWRYEVSPESHREGMIDSTTFFIAYFYPRVAVYDDYRGWDWTEYSEQLEFYNDFNDYDLKVEAPDNFMVWATGSLVNPEEVLQPEIEKKLNQSMAIEQVTRIVTPEEWRAKNVTRHNPVNTWHWKADNIPDMAFGISDHYDWDGSSTIVDDHTGRRVSAQAAYCDTAADYHFMSGYARHAVDLFSHHWPGVPYPYGKTVIFQGYAGMEYPMMVNDESYEDTVISRWVAEHEISHTYMPFYMGINETFYGFMDEGWATTFELLIGRSDLGLKEANEGFRKYRVADWAGNTSADQDLPIITPGNNLTSGLNINEYGKPSLGYLAMMDLLGEDLFKKCLHEYMDRWHGKHPTPWDFFYTFNNASGQDLNWFWNSWFFSNNYIDLGITAVNKIKKGYEVMVHNTGGMDIPFYLVTIYTDNSHEVRHIKPDIWSSGAKTVSVEVNTRKKIQLVNIDSGIFMDAKESDNDWIMK